VASTLLTDEELRRVAATIAEAEEATSGEIRVNIHKRRSWSERKLSLHDLAVKHFHLLGMHQTKEKTGVLIFLCIKDRAFHIVADEGINTKIHQEYWDALAETMARHFKTEKFCEGICFAVREIGALLAKEFPVGDGDTNELSNDVSFS
jgi:uncharacterized membrane protein